MKPRRKKWLIVSGAIVLSLGIWAVTWVRGAGEPPQFLTLADGTKYRFGGATWGTNQVPPFFAERLVYHLPAAISNWVQKNYGTNLGLSATWQTAQPELQVWMDQIAGPAGQMFPITPARGLLADEHGVEAGMPYSYIGGFYPWESVTYSFVPRRSRTLEVHFYLNDSLSRPIRPQVGSVRFRNPLYRNYPQWQPETLPSTKAAGDVQVTLTNCSIGNQQANALETVFGLDLKQPFNTNEHWAIQNFEASDATGNTISGDGYSIRNGGHECSVAALFWPGENAIRLKIWLKRTEGFSSNESLTVTNLPLPLPNATSGVAITNRIDGHLVLMRNFVKPRPQFAGRWQIYEGVRPFPFQISMVMEDQSPNLLAEIQSVKTDFGELLPNYESRRQPDGESRNFESFPQGAKGLSVTITVQQLRTVEFLVKPPNPK